MSYLHPSATDAFDKRASDIFQRFSVSTATQPLEWQPELHAAFTLTGENIIGAMLRWDVDGRSGKTVRFCIDWNGVAHELDRGGCELLATLCESLSAHHKVATVANNEDIRAIFLDWVSLALHSKISDPFCVYLDEHLSTRVAMFEVWVPIEDLELEGPLVVGPYQLTPASEQLLRSRWAVTAEAMIGNGRTLAEARGEFTASVLRFQGRPVLVSNHTALPSHAARLAALDAERVCSLLSCLQPVNQSCEGRSYLAPQGQGGLEHQRAYLFEESALTQTVAVSSSPLPFPLRLSAKRVAVPWLARRIASISSLLLAHRATGLQRRLLRALNTYSRCARARTPGEKLVFAFAALETLLLVSDQEPIQSNLGRRAGILLTSELAARKQIAASFKKAYALRSRFMHHGELLSRENYIIANSVLSMTYEIMMLVLGRHESFGEYESLGEWLDDQLLGAPSEALDACRVDGLPDRPELRSGYQANVVR